ncbi:MAG: ORF6N domain-containing protein [Nitratireductor sp.]|nr:ORF6N domain-containing protein [Nitratireductor sp.]
MFAVAICDRGLGMVVPDKDLETKQVHALIREIRGRRVIVDSDLAMLFGTQTRRLNQQVKRNSERFADFAFQLTPEEFEELRSQNATANARRGGRTSLPWAFDEYGTAMASTVMNTPQAIAALRLVIRVFVAVRSQIQSGSSGQELGRESESMREMAYSLREKLYQMAQAIADFEINKRDRATVRQEFDRITTSVLDNVKAQLEAKAIANESVLADVQKKLAETEKLYAEARKTHSEADRMDIENAKEQVKFLREIVSLIDSTDTTRFSNAMEMIAGRQEIQ